METDAQKATRNSRSDRISLRDSREEKQALSGTGAGVGAGTGMGIGQAGWTGDSTFLTSFPSPNRVFGS